MAESTPNNESHLPTRRVWRRRLAGLAFVIVALLLGAYLVFTSSWYVLRQARPILSRALGGDVTAARAHIDSQGRLTFEEVTLRAPGVSGTAGEVLAIDRVEIEMDSSKIWRGEFIAREIVLRGATIRLSELEDKPGVFNFDALRPEPVTGDKGEGGPPRVTLETGSLEVGSHSEGRYESRGSLPIVGEMYASPGDSEFFIVTLAEAAEGGGVRAEGLRLEGRFRPKTFEYEGRLTGAAFSERLYNLLPTMGRRWWDRLELSGRIANVRLQLNKDHQLWSAIEVDEVGMTIPVETDGIWARYSNGQVSPSEGLPRMTVKSGTIRLEGDELVLDNLIGELSSTAETPGLSYRVVGRIGSLPSFEWRDRESWMRTVVERAPLNVVFRLEDFQFSPETEHDAVELPLAVARVLERLTVRTAVLDTEIHLRRERPASDELDAEPSPLTSNGRVVIRNGAGAFDKFPYPMRDVQGSVTFTMDELHIESVVGRGSGDSIVTLVGRVAPLVREALVDLTIEARAVPIDDQLLNSFDKGTRGAFDSLFDQVAFERLRSAGLFRNESSELAAEWAPDFSPGGLINLSLSVDRPFGANQRTTTTGTVNVAHADFLYSGFPYPFRVSRGQLLLEEDRIRVVDFLVTTPGGGTGLVSGEIALPQVDGESTVAPNLEIEVVNDRINNLLLAAIPLTREEQMAGNNVDDWPGRTQSRAAHFVDAIGLDGTLSYVGSVRTNEQQVLDYRFSVAIQSGSAGIESERVTESGVPWPAGLVIDEIHGILEISPGRIELRKLRGQRGSGIVEANGEILIADGPGRIALDASFIGMQVEPYLINLFAVEDRPAWQTWWDQYQPDGRFDLNLAYESGIDEYRTPVLSVIPRGLGIRVGGKPLEVSSSAGAVQIEDDTLSFDDVLLTIGPDGIDGSVELDGSAHLGGGTSLNAKWTDARLEAPWLRELIAQYGGDQTVEWYTRLQPSGRFDAVISYDTAAPERVNPLLIEIQPRDVTIHRRGNSAQATFAPTSRITIDPGGLWLHNVRGVTADELEFALDGTIGRVGDELRAELSLDVHAPGTVPSLELLLPDDVQASLASVGFRVLHEVRVDDAILRLRSRDEATDHLIFRGAVQVRGGVIDAGVLFEEIDGTVQINAERHFSETPTIELSFVCDRALAVRRVLQDVYAELTLSPSGDRWLLPSLEATLYRGSVVASAQFGTSTNADYSVQVDLVGVDMPPFTQPDLISAVPEEQLDSTGRLFGSLRLRGERNLPDSREGRGGVRILGGQMANAPITMSLVQLSQLMLPLHSSLNFAEASYFIRGETIIVERLMLESPTLILNGDGTMSYASGDLDLRLRPRGKLGPLSDVVGALADQLYAIEVRGTLAEPRASLVVVPGVGGLFEGQPQRPTVEVEHRRELPR